ASSAAWKKTRQVVQTAAEPPNQGRISFAMTGCTRKSRNALVKIVSAKRSMACTRGPPLFAGAKALRGDAHSIRASSAAQAVFSASDGGVRPVVREMIHRAHRDVLDVDTLQHLERHFVARVALRPHVLIELVLRVNRIGSDAED